MTDRPAPPRMDRSAFSVVSSFEEAEAKDREWWWAQTPEFRLQMIEYLRKMNYGAKPTGRLQRVIEFVERRRG